MKQIDSVSGRSLHRNPDDSTMSRAELTDRLKSEAIRLGFDAVGIAPAVAPPGYPDFRRWLDFGHAAGMDYLRRNEAARAHPSCLLEGVRSVIMASVVYGQNAREAIEESSRRGKVACYARGGDYHALIWRKLEELLAWLRGECPGAAGRAVADTAPLLERDFARLAGLGWIGKNTMLIDRRLGSFTFLGALLVDVELEYDAAHDTDFCGSCTLCLDHCPTQAFAGPYELDARRCISFWTIEHKGAIPEKNALELDGWVFGCDVCQDVCPWNRKAPEGHLSELEARLEWIDPDLIEWLSRDRSQWRALLKGTSLTRAKRSGLVRNAALVLGTRKLAQAAAPLAERLDDPDEDAVVRVSSAWALGQIGTEPARAALLRHAHDPDSLVREAVSSALRAGDPVSEERNGPSITSRTARVRE
jgi:epoxyqueuosine reductase